MLYIFVDTGTMFVYTRRGMLFVEAVRLHFTGTQLYETYATPVAWAGRRLEWKRRVIASSSETS